MSTRTRGFIAPSCQSAFRKTRSGKEFSPWNRDVGEPVHAPDFDLEARLREVFEAPDLGSPTSAALADPDPDDSLVTSPSIADHDDTENDLSTPVDLDALFKGFTRTSKAQTRAKSALAANVFGCTNNTAARVESQPQGRSDTLKHSIAPNQCVSNCFDAPAPAPASALSPGPSSPRRASNHGQAGPCPTDEANVPLGSPNHVQGRKAHANKHAKEQRRRRRAANAAKEAFLYPDGKVPKSSALRQIQKAMAMFVDEDLDGILRVDNLTKNIVTPDAIETDFSLEMDDVPVTSSAYVARLIKQTTADRRKLSVDEVRKLPGFRYIPWNGRITRAVLDKRRRIIVLLDGRPNDESWDGVNKDLSAIFPIIASAYRFQPSHKPNRRGAFDTISCGISYGGGQKRVGNFAMSKHNRQLWSLILKLRAIHRVANFANTSMKVFFPKLHEHYQSVLTRICAHDPTLKRNFDDNAFAAISINLGPQAVSYVHTDHLNLAYGLCAITAVGNYDHVKGGHLILWDLRLVIEFPPGSTILIPSAIIRHSNTALAGEDERRYAFLQYSAGGLFRWADCGYRSQKSFLAAGSTFEMSGKERWERGIDMYSDWDALREGHL